MRLLEIARSFDDVPAIKAWLNPTTGDAVMINIHESHENALRENPRRYGLDRDDVGDDMEDHAINAALANGWVRIANFNDATLAMIAADVDDIGYVTAASLSLVRRGVAWLKKQNLLPAVIAAEVGYGTGHSVVLRDEQIDAFVRSGALPR